MYVHLNLSHKRYMTRILPPYFFACVVVLLPITPYGNSSQRFMLIGLSMYGVYPHFIPSQSFLRSCMQALL